MHKSKKTYEKGTSDVYIIYTNINGHPFLIRHFWCGINFHLIIVLSYFWVETLVTNQNTVCSIKTLFSSTKIFPTQPTYLNKQYIGFKTSWDTMKNHSLNIAAIKMDINVYN